jgi:hypothetical protein
MRPKLLDIFLVAFIFFSGHKACAHDETSGEKYIYLAPGSTVKDIALTNGDKGIVSDQPYEIAICEYKRGGTCNFVKGNDGLNKKYFGKSPEFKNPEQNDFSIAVAIHPGERTTYSDYQYTHVNRFGKETNSGIINVALTINPPPTGKPAYEVPAEFVELVESPDYRIPIISPASRENLYSLVYLDMYIRGNPLGFLNGNWITGQTLEELSLEVTDGVISGLDGIWISTAEWIPTFNNDGKVTYSTSGTLYTSVSGDAIDSQESSFVPGPLPIFGVGAAFGFSRKLRKRIKAAHHVAVAID